MTTESERNPEPLLSVEFIGIATRNGGPTLAMLLLIIAMMT